MAKKQTTERRPFEGIKAGLEDAIAFAQGDRTRGRVARQGDRPWIDSGEPERDARRLIRGADQGDGAPK